MSQRCISVEGSSGTPPCDPLANPIWSALTGDQSPFALGETIGQGGARRYDPQIGPLAGVRETSPECLDDLAWLLRETGPIALLLENEPAPQLPGGTLVKEAAGIQMVFTGTQAPMVATDSAPLPIRMDTADYGDLLELAAMTQPGPFASRTAELGKFWGLRENGRLIAMAGQRMRPSGHVEVSAVCTHPDARGRRLAPLLMAKVIADVLEEGRTPLLHSYADNAHALSLYARLDFAPSRTVTLAFYVPAQVPLRDLSGPARLPDL